LQPVDGHRDCPTCSGKVQVWYRGDEDFRVTGSKHEWNEVVDRICYTCRFDRKRTSDGVIDQPSLVAKDSVIRKGHYGGQVGSLKPNETCKKVMKGREPKLVLNIHDVSEVNEEERDLSKINRPPTSLDYKE